MKDDLEDSKDIAEQATYEDESATVKRTVTIPLAEYSVNLFGSPMVDNLR